MTSRFLVFVALVFLFSSVNALSKRGVLNLDEMTFDKIVDGSRTVLVEFAENSLKISDDYEKVAAKLHNDNTILVAAVDCKDNIILKQRFGVTVHPTARLFLKGSTTPIEYPGSVDAESLIHFVHAELNPEVTKLRKLASQVIYADKQKEAIEEMKEVVSKLPEHLTSTGKVFLKSAEQVQKSGVDFLTKEKERLEKLINHKNTPKDKQREFQQRVSILDAFNEVQ